MGAWVRRTAGLDVGNARGAVDADTPMCDTCVTYAGSALRLSANMCIDLLAAAEAV